MKAKRNLIMLGSLHTVFLDRSSPPAVSSLTPSRIYSPPPSLSLCIRSSDSVSFSFKRFEPSTLSLSLSASLLSVPFLSLSVHRSDSPCSLSLSRALAYFRVFVLVQAGSCVRNGNYFLRRNKAKRPGPPPIRETKGTPTSILAT